ncbi:WD40 repeat-like protein [Rhizoclosmatium globosum]|uniref:WD40 repeat-like protein n=1 Tax=Rhizoclosmatium globosum TaxID=329046 RepID=A0A1Y2CGL5_9FUNG|nr:WD40 repeat-like protein [Rhizoclosmatium globosum]|eukprot:ORY45465.1 WD40 repeat-like protein [Rhizoclosmatium globosum]
MNLNKASPPLNAKPCPINEVYPDELLLLSLAHLDPLELRLCASVCRRWNAVINDDSCWRLALTGFMRGSLPVRRIAKKSWRSEFLRRFRLLKEWKAGGKRVVQFDPRIGRIEQILVDFDEDRLYAGSLEKGMVIICNPTTGKVERDAVYFNTDLETREISTLLIEKSRIIAGHLSGRITMVTQFISKPSMNHSINHFVGFHEGPVTALAVLPNTPGLIISGGSDGRIRIWDVSTFQCLRVSESSRPITFISFDAKNHIVASSNNGLVSVWDVDMLALSKDSTLAHQLMELETTRAFVHKSQNVAIPIHSLIHDLSSATLVTAVNAPLPEGIAIWSLSNPETPIVEFKPSPTSSSTTIASVTKIAWDRPTVPPSGPVSILVSGHSDSSCLIWHVPESVISPTTGSSTRLNQPLTTVTIQPVRKIQVAVSSPLSTLTLDPFKLIVSTTDGLIKSYDIATGLSIKAVSVRRSGEVGGPLSRVVTCVWGGEWNLIVATAGGHVRNWDFAPVEGGYGTGGYGKMKGRKKLLKKSGGGVAPTTPTGLNSGGRGSVGKAFGGKAHLVLDVKTEVMATSMELKREKEEEARRVKLLQKMNGAVATPPGFGVVGMGRAIVGAPPAGTLPSNLVKAGTTASPSVGSGSGAMTEQEMVDYAIMLSMEEQNDPFLLGDAYGSSPAKAIGSIDLRRTTPVLDEGSMFSPVPSSYTPKPHAISTKPPVAPATPVATGTSSQPRSPANPWSTGKSFASVAAAASATASNASLASPSIVSSRSSLVAFSESRTSPDPRTSPTNPFYARNSLTPQSRFHPMAWYDDDEWEDEADFYRLPGKKDADDSNMYTPSKRRSSLSLSLAGILPPPVEDNETVIGSREPGEWEQEESTPREGGRLSDSGSMDIKRPTSAPQHPNITRQSPSLPGSWSNKISVSGGRSLESGANNASQYGSIHMRRSPRLGPMGQHISPRMAPAYSPSLAPTTQFSGVGVQVAPRATADDEDEELMFVLALSMSDQ